MTDAKKLKRKIRERASRTGESYAAARRHVVNQVDQARQDRTREAADTARSGPATGAVSETRCMEATGHGFDHWFEVLDRFGAAKQGHTAAARHLKEEHGVSAWYSQSITVIYERARGLREINQACEGNYQVSATKVLRAPFAQAHRLLTDLGTDATWLDSIDDDVAQWIREGRDHLRTKDTAVWLRLKLPDGRVELRISDGGDGRSRAVARVEQLSSAEAVEPERARFKQVLAAMAAALT